jgi:hypothetical protein
MLKIFENSSIKTIAEQFTSSKTLLESVIKESESPLSSPVLTVKKNGDRTFCMDYKKLNNVTRKDCFLLPRIDNILDTLAGAKWFSTPDMKCGYWQVALHSDSKEKMAS